MRTKRIIYTLLVISLLTIAFFATGYLAPQEYVGERRDSFIDTQIDVWRNLTSLETITGRKPEVERVVVIEENRDGIIWTEYLKNGKQRTLRVAEREVPTYFVVERIQSDDGLTGRWEFYLSENKDTKMTDVLIKEKSTNTNIVLRAWHTIIGRSINLRREMKSLRVSLFQRLLNTP
jgi:hypothetical protein